jgi:glycosyltransferase involved in cell wall biosynthesis
MTHHPHVSVVVCTYNKAASLRLTLASLAAQVTPPDLAWELLVVDNNSTDATPSVVDQFASSAHIPVRTVFVPDQGLSRARNAGLTQSRGEVIGFTDDDVHPASDWVARIAAGMRKTGADIVGGRILPAWHVPPPAWLEQRAFHGLLSLMDYTAPADVLNAHRAPCVWGANMAFRRAVFEKVGLFDPRRGIQGTRRYGGEETELVGRALAAGCRAVYDPELVVWHRIGPERVRIRYLSRVAFRRAEGDVRVQSVGARRSPLGVPLGMYRATVGHVGRWVTALVLRRPDAIQRWLDCCRAAGAIWGACRRHGEKPPSVRSSA